MSWDNDISEITAKVMVEFDVPKELEGAIRKAVLLGLQRSTDNWLRQQR